MTDFWEALKKVTDADDSEWKAIMYKCKYCGADRPYAGNQEFGDHRKECRETHKQKK